MNTTRDPVTVPEIRSRKFKNQTNQKLSALTAYDYTMARLLDAAGVDIILVGDSLGSVVQGHKNTIPVSLEEMIYHCRCVSRGVRRSLLVGDLPFMSYQVSPEQAIESAGRLLKEGEVAAVKLEGGVQSAAAIQKIVDADIPVMGHVGLTPQSFHRMGGHKVQGRTRDAQLNLEAGTRERILADAQAAVDAGVFSIVLEGIPDELAAEITEMLPVPTIGIGAGVHCDGQILVTQDMLGMDPDFSPKFVKRFAELGVAIREAAMAYCTEVQTGAFPEAKHSFGPFKKKDHTADIKLA